MNDAHWIQRTHLFCVDEFICSECGFTSGKPKKVCPACGATMKQAKYDASWVNEAEGLSALLDNDW